MPQGLQCWDASGNLVVDLTDYAIRYIGATSVSFAQGESSKNVSFPGVTQAGSIVTIVSSSVAYSMNEFYCRAYDGGFNALYLPTGGTQAITLNVEIYSFQ